MAGGSARRRAAELAEDIQISSRLRFEPFFVPRAPVLKDVPSTTAVQRIGVEIFNQRPGQGVDWASLGAEGNHRGRRTGTKLSGMAASR